MSNPRLFICHASEDKDSVARPLAEALGGQGVSVWFDEYSLSLGDSLRREIDKGLAECDFGVVVLSPSFFAKEWPRRELDGLTAREVAERRKVILPVWHEIDAEEIARASPSLADKVAISTKSGIRKVSAAILSAIGHKDTSLMISAEDLAEAHDRAEYLYSVGIAQAESKEFENDEIIEYVKRDILEFFKRMNLDVGHVLPARPFFFQRMMQYNPKQKAAFDAAVERLVSDGLVERRNGDLVLTTKGVDAIY